jgi:hypothetical protein
VIKNSIVGFEFLLRFNYIVIIKWNVTLSII